MTILTRKQDSLFELQRSINVQKLLRFNLQDSDLTVELESGRALQLVQFYIEGLKLGKELPKTELQPADDLAVLAAQVFVSMYDQSSDVTHLHNAVVFLEFASKKSPQSYQIHLSLNRIYRLLGVFYFFRRSYHCTGLTIAFARRSATCARAVSASECETGSE